MHHFIDDRKIKCAHHEVVPYSFNAIDPRLARFTFIELIVVNAAYWIRADNSYFQTRFGGLFLEILPGPRYCSTGAYSTNQAIDLAIRILPDFWPRCQIMGLRIVHIKVLIGVKSAGRLARDFLGDLHVAVGMIVREIGSRDDHFGPVGL